MDKKFKQAMSRLNTLQRQAVETIEGPVLVVAGPGTGKTELLSMRVANILRTTDARPQSILSLTFTNKAAINMKSRIIEQVGPAGSKVAASTFHSFAAEIMNLYPDCFWNSARLAVAPDTVQLETVESIIRGLPLNNPLALKFAGQYTLLSAVQRAINLTKQAGLTPDKLRAIINVNLAYIDTVQKPLADILDSRLSAKNLDSLRAQIKALPKQEIDELVYPLSSLSTVITDSLADAIAKDEGTGKTTNTSKWKTRWIQTVNGQRGMFAERDRNQWWLELANVYELYRQELHQRSFYDYADMLVEVITQLEQNPGMLADIQERFSYVLIDEFQDTTPAQLRLAHLIADHFSAAGRPNLMAVGDDDQSIYKFNGAELNNMLGFKRAYPSAKIIVLTDNYRSTQALLDTAKKIIEQADSRLVNSDPTLKKALVARKARAAGRISATAYASQELQLSEVARDIKKNYSPTREIAVLARSHGSLIKMASILQGVGVPVRYEQSSNILEHELINQVYLLAKLLVAIQNGDRQTADGLIHQIVRWPAWGLDPKQLWGLAVETAGKSWLDALSSSRSPDLKAIGGWLLWLAAHADSQPLAITIEQLIGLRESPGYTSPVKTYLSAKGASGTNDYFHSLSAIQLLRAMVHEFAADKQPSLAQFVRFIEVNKQNEVVIADESPFITGSKAVQLLSVHKAKGLEFDHVYIIDAVEDNWRPKSNNRRPPSNLPLQPPLDEFDDYVRLLYVAATRAKSALSISAYYQDHSGKDVGVSNIVLGALPVTRVEQKDKQKLIEVLEENLRWPALSGGQEKQMLAAKLEQYNLYATHLLNFLDVSRGGPQYFKEKNLLYLPELKTGSLAYGTAMHAALESAQRLTNAGTFKIAAVKRDFDVALKAEQLMGSDYARYLKQGHDTIDKLFKVFGYRLPKGSLTEQKHKDVMVGPARIGGTLDRLDNQAGQLNIADYKTGSPLSSFETKDKNKAIRAYKHKLQLIFYALLVAEQTGAKAGSIAAQMVYVEADSASGLERSYTPTDEDLDYMRRLITAVWRKIMKLELPDTSSYSQDINGIRRFETDLLAGK